MRLSSCSLPALLLALVIPACSGSTALDGDDDDDSKNSSSGGSEADDDDDDDDDDGASSGGRGASSGSDPSETPHALGTIQIAETHQPGANTSTASVSARFLPDANAASSCASLLEDCEVLPAALCNETTDTTDGCPQGTVCGYGDDCQLRCAAPCSGDGCDAEPFDAGLLRITGLPDAVTLEPPYDPRSGGGFAFEAGAALQVTADGASGAGFAAFEESFEATTRLRTAPGLDGLAAQSVYGTGSVEVGWLAGSDSIDIVLSGNGGTAICHAEDSTGSFAIPRAVVEAALGPKSEDPRLRTGARNVSIGVARRRTDVREGLGTQGTLENATVQSEGWLALSTSSAEAVLVKGCRDGYDDCSGLCAKLATSPQNCGTCGHSCAAGEGCFDGGCQPAIQVCLQCVPSALDGPCAGANDACNGSAACTELRSCYSGCNSDSCKQICRNAAPAQAEQQSEALDACLNTSCPACDF